MVFRSDILGVNLTNQLRNFASTPLFSASVQGSLGDLGAIANIFRQNRQGGGNPLAGIAQDVISQFGSGGQGFNIGAQSFFGGGAEFTTASGQGGPSDARVRLSAKSAYTDGFQGPGAPLRATNGIIFPYTPNISVSHQVEYSTYELVHTNYQQHAYSKTRNPAIQIQAVFPSQTPEEAVYTVGVLHFLRVASKMNFGQSNNPGTPPPVLEFSGYGTYNFNRVPVLIGNFTLSYEDGVDYISFDNNLQIPTIMSIAIDLLPQYSPARQNEFSIESFANGSLYAAGYI